jgi:hypothetical protein
MLCKRAATPGCENQCIFAARSRLRGGVPMRGRLNGSMVAQNDRAAVKKSAAPAGLGLWFS